MEPIGFYHGDWARLVMQANYIEDIPLNPHGFFPGEAVTMLTPMDRGVEERQKTIEAIRTGRLTSADFVGSVVPYTEAPAIYEKLKNREILSAAYKWNER